MLAHAQTYRFTVEEYRKLGEVGLFDENDRVELINGEIIVMSPIGYRHGQTVTNLVECLMEQARRRFMVSPQNPVELDHYSEPQPTSFSSRAPCAPPNATRCPATCSCSSR